MSGNDLGPGSTEYSRPPWFARHQRILGAGVVIVALAVLVASTWVGGWGVLGHESCVTVGGVSSEVVWIPAPLVNSPYGGNASGNASFPPGFIGGWLANANGIGGVLNGSVGGAFLHVLVNVSERDNETIWGPGANDRCGQRFAMTWTISFNSSAYAMSNLSNRGNWSDANEPHMYNFTFPRTPTNSTAYFENGFRSANAAQVTTCGTGPKFLPMRSPGVTVWLTFDLHGQSTTIPYLLPFPQVYHYYFPANFGTWQVDNLSAPGGPGGGWAFSFVGPCA